MTDLPTPALMLACISKRANHPRSLAWGFSTEGYILKTMDFCDDPEWREYWRDVLALAMIQKVGGYPY